ncbi:unnamed protein product [Echinostoma caproni]|uniref:Uncharacterized protein n=1 Tax=Echinostoma caproni TaxID=27848 RepID=A0A183B0V7_9TREM|nr:unnamed protein product [Echinostoma caproni]
MDLRRLSYRRMSMLPSRVQQESPAETETNERKQSGASCENPQAIDSQQSFEDDPASLDEVNVSAQENWYRRLEVKKRPWNGIHTYLIRRKY